jgi:hypothetical protein
MPDEANPVLNPPAPSPTPAPAPPPPVAQAPPPVVPLTVEEYNRLRGLEGQFVTIQAERAKDLQKAKDEQLKLMAEKEGAEKALAEQKKQWEANLQAERNSALEFQAQIFNERTERTFAESLSGREFFGDTPEHRAIIQKQVASQLRERFETVRDASGVLVTREKATGMPAEHVLPKLLDSIEFAHFFKPKGKGGSLSPAAAPYNPTRHFEAGSLEDVADQWKQAQGKYPAIGLGPVSRQ